MGTSSIVHSAVHKMFQEMGSVQVMKPYLSTHSPSPFLGIFTTRYPPFPPNYFPTNSLTSSAAKSYFSFIYIPLILQGIFPTNYTILKPLPSYCLTYSVVIHLNLSPVKKSCYPFGLANQTSWYLFIKRKVLHSPVHF